MRPFSHVEMHRRTFGKGSGTNTFDIKIRGNLYDSKRTLSVHVTEEGGWKKLRVSVSLHRKPTTEELERIRTLFFFPHETCLHLVTEANREGYVDLWEPPTPITPP